MSTKLNLPDISNENLVKNLTKLNPTLNYTFPIETLEYLKGHSNGTQDFTELIDKSNILFSNVANKLSKSSFVDSRIIDEMAFIGEVQGSQYGDIIEMMNVGQAKIYPYFPGSTPNQFIREVSDLKVLYYNQSFRSYSRQTIDLTEVQKAFRNSNGVGSLMQRKLSSMDDAHVLQKQYIKQNLLKLGEENYAFSKVTDITNEETAKAFLGEMLDLADAIARNTREYNAMNIITATNPSDMYLVMDVKYKKIFTTMMMANSRQPEYLNMPFEIKWVKELGCSKKPHNLEGEFQEPAGVIENAVGLLVDKEFFKLEIEVDYHDMARQAEGRYTNHFRHLDGKAYMVWFKNAVLLTTTDRTHKEDSIYATVRKTDNETEVKPDPTGK